MKVIDVGPVPFLLSADQYRCGVENLAALAVITATMMKAKPSDALTAVRAALDDLATTIVATKIEVPLEEAAKLKNVDFTAWGEAAQRLAIAALVLWAMLPGTECAGCADPNGAGCDEEAEDPTVH